MSRPSRALDADFDALLGRAVAARMKLHDVAGKDLAVKVELSPPALSDRLTGKTPFKASELNRVALALGCPVATLYEWATTQVTVGKSDRGRDQRERRAS